MRSRHSRLIICLLIASFIFMAGCWQKDEDTNSNSTSNSTLVSIAVLPENPSINVGSSQSFLAKGTYSDGQTLDITDIVTWDSSNEVIATILARGVANVSGGLATALAPGVTQITASLNGITSPTRTLTVYADNNDASLIEITITPEDPNIVLGEGLKFIAKGKYSDNSLKDISSSVTWLSSNEQVADIIAGGFATAKAVGQTQITATLSTVTSEPQVLTVINPTLTKIDVTPVNPSINLGQTQQLTATGVFSGNTTQNLTNTVTWVSSNQQVAVFGTNGLIITKAIGQTQITASQNGLTSSPQTLTVKTILQSIAITPINPLIGLGGSQEFTAIGTYANNTTQDITNSVTWSSSNQQVAVIETGGVATAKTLGETEVTASLNGLTSAAQTLSVCLSATTLMGEIHIGNPAQAAKAFQQAVLAVKNAVLNTTPVTWMVMSEIPMPFPTGSYGTLLEIGAPMFGDNAMAMGQHHALGMPCKIGIWTEDSNNDQMDDLIKINILNESIVFPIFFADVIMAEGFDEFATLIKALVQGIIETAIDDLNGSWICAYQGPYFTKPEITAIQSWVTSPGGYAGEKGYGLKLEIPLAGNKAVGQSAADFLTEVKTNIMAAIGYTPYSRDDWHVIDPNLNIPVGDFTDPNNPFAEVGEIKICSPYYAAQVVAMGGKYMIAMPCTISVWLNDLTMDNQGSPVYKKPDKVYVAILNPEFILPNYFKDLLPALPSFMQEQMLGMGTEIKNQVLAMVNHGLKDYVYPNHLPPRFSTNILMGKVPLLTNQPTKDAFEAAVSEMKKAVADYPFTPQGQTNPIKPWKVVGELKMPFPEGSYGTLLEVCAPIFADDAMSMGQHHSLGMPCKIGLFTEDTNEDDQDDTISIYALDEAAIFAFYFADVKNAEGFDDFAAMIKTQTKEIVKTAISNLAGEWIFEHKPPFFTQEELAAVQSWVTNGGYAGQKGYAVKFELPLAGNMAEGQSAADFLKQIKNNLVLAINMEGENLPYEAQSDWHVVNPNFNIPVGDFTKPDNPFAEIGEIKLCSPYYAGQVMSLGGKYMVTMPCTISVWLNDLTFNSQGQPVYQTPDKIIVGLLNPEFVLKNFFKDLPTEVKEPMAGMGTQIKNELTSIIDYALTRLQVSSGTDSDSVSTSISLDETQQFRATLIYSNGQTKDITSQVTWSSSNKAVATISSFGLATALSYGQTQITATYNGFTSLSQTLNVCLAGTILMGKIPIISADKVAETFQNTVWAVKNSIFEFSFIPQIFMDPINPFWSVVGEAPMPFPEGSYGTLLEVCSPMIADNAMAMGQHHALGMPCKIGLWTEDEDFDGIDDCVKINILNESLIFAIYFADVVKAEGFGEFETIIKDQIKEIVESAVIEMGGEYFYKHQPPYYTQTEVANLQAWVSNGGYAGESGYGLRLEIPLTGNKDDGQSAPEFLSEVKANIMAAIGQTPYSRDDWHVINTNFNIPVGDYTKPQNPFASIGEIKVCSAYYAEQVVAMGGKYMVAMPCTISVWLNDLTMDSQGRPVYQEPDRVIVNILKPEFILQNYFKDIVPYLPAAVQQQMGGMGLEIKNQVLAMVNNGLKSYSYPNHLYPRLSTNMLMGKITIDSDEETKEAFDKAVLAVKKSVDTFIVENCNPSTPWVVVGEIKMPFQPGSYGKLLEICAPIYADDAMAMGQHHSLGMPCKVGIWTEDIDSDGTDETIYINTLDESAIFEFFFADVRGANGFDDFAAMIKTQTKEIVKSSVTKLRGKWIFEHQAPFFTHEEVTEIQKWTTEGGYAGEKGYGLRVEIPFAWNKDDEVSKTDFLMEIKKKIIASIGHTPEALDDWHVINKFFNIPVGDYTQANNPFASIGEIKLCSPTYAEQVVGLGGKYMVAMPCTISVWLNDLSMNSQGQLAYQEPNKVVVSVLNPEFILQHYFKDLPADILSQMAGMGPEIKNQVLAMVNNALKDYYMKGLWQSDFEAVADLARDYLANLKSGAKKPTIKAEDLYLILTNSDIMDNPFILSVRDPAHYELGHIPEAINIPWRNVAKESSLAQLPEDGSSIVTYCYSGHTGQIAATILNILGYNAVNLKYGMSAWTIDKEVRALPAFKDPNDSHDYPIETTINSLSELEVTPPPVLDFDTQDAKEATLAAAMAYLSDTDRSPTITAQRLYELMNDSNPYNDPLIISVREQTHYQDPGIGHIPGAYNIPFKNIADEENLCRLPTNRLIVTYCYTGHTGQLAATILNILGYNAVNLKYGMMSWTRNPATRVFAPFTEGVDSHDYPLE